jgi:type IV pilus assembly protein PilX
MVLVTSLLLLVIVTILALSMFRSYGLQERIAGNVREKQRALQAAVSAQQYAEWWLSSGTNSTGAPVTCVSTVLDANLNQGQICNAASALGAPWDPNSWTGHIDYKPASMTVQTGGGNASYYDQKPRFYITDLGTSASGSAEIYKITAAGYGGTQNAVAVVESTYSLSSGVVDRGGL